MKRAPSLVWPLALALFLATGCAKQEAAPATGASYAAELARVEAKADRVLGAPAPADEAQDDGVAASATKKAKEESVPSDDERRALLREAERVFSSKSAPSGSSVTLLRQDLAERSARVALSLGQTDEALGWIERGLALDRAPSLVVANLLVGRADILEALGRADEARGSLVEALGVNQALLAQELDE